MNAALAQYDKKLKDTYGLTAMAKTPDSPDEQQKPVSYTHLRFASFMYDRFPEVKHFTEISRDMIEDYLVYIKTDTGLTSVSYTHLDVYKRQE